MKIIVLCLVVVPLLAGRDSFAGGAVERVSIYELIANPATYNGKLVYLKGFLWGHPPNIGLYPSRDDGVISNLSARIVLRNPDSLGEIATNCAGGFVSISGQFSFEPESRIRSLSQLRSAIGLEGLDEHTGVLKTKLCTTAELPSANNSE